MGRSQIFILDMRKPGKLVGLEKRHGAAAEGSALDRQVAAGAGAVVVAAARVTARQKEVRAWHGMSRRTDARRLIVINITVAFTAGTLRTRVLCVKTRTVQSSKIGNDRNPGKCRPVAPRCGAPWY